MSIFAVIVTETNICDNIIVLDDPSAWPAPQDHYEINIDGVEVGIGWTYNPDAKTWSAPIVPVKEGKS